MIVTVNIENTNIEYGGYENDKLVFSSRIAAEARKTADQYAVEFLEIMRLYQVDKFDVNGAVIASVVPPLGPIIGGMLKKLFGCKVFVVGPGIKTGLNIKVDNPAGLGADIVSSAVGCLNKYKMPCIILNLETATTIAALDEKGVFLGVSIIAGVNTSLRALFETTAQLPFFSADFSGNIPVIGENDAESMMSGAVIGTAAMVDGMIERFKSIIGEEASVVATGYFAKIISRYCKNKITVDENLLNDGLYRIYRKNA